jgi:1-acyl-sn-glycerol-3-phosphate acyltransferase
MPLMYRLTSNLLRAYFFLFHRYRIYGADRLQIGKAILAPNHLSFLDPPLLGAATPEEVHFLARSSLFHSRFFQWLLPQLNAHPLYQAPQDVQSLRYICQLLNEEKKVVIFAEGGRSDTGQLQTIKSGVAMLALRTQCPIIPVWIQGTFEAWPRHKKIPKPTSISCAFGKPLLLDSAMRQLDKKQAQEQLTQQLQSRLEELRNWFKTGAQGELP